MTAPADPLAAAQKVTSQDQAGRLWWALEEELVTGSRDEGWQHAAREAQDELAADWGGANELRKIGAALNAPAPPAPRPRSGPRSAPSSPPRPRSGPAPRSAPPGSPRRRSTAPSSTPRRSSPRSSSTPRIVRRAAEVSGATQVYSTTTDLVIAGFRAALGLALVYLLLSPRGTKGLTGALKGVGSAVNLLLAPVDPLNPPAKRKAPTNAGGVPMLTPGEDLHAYDKRLNDYLLTHPNAKAPAKPTSGAGVFGAPNIGGFPSVVSGKGATTSTVHP